MPPIQAQSLEVDPPLELRFPEGQVYVVCATENCLGSSRTRFASVSSKWRLLKNPPSETDKASDENTDSSAFLDAEPCRKGAHARVGSLGKRYQDIPLQCLLQILPVCHSRGWVAIGLPSNGKRGGTGSVIDPARERIIERPVGDQFEGIIVDEVLGGSETAKSDPRRHPHSDRSVTMHKGFSLASPNSRCLGLSEWE